LAKAILQLEVRSFSTMASMSIYELGILEERSQKLQIKKEGKTHSNKRCIPAVLGCLFDKVAANHKITSFKTTDSAVLHNWLIQFDD
jgi:hypothetical protein